MNKDLVSILIPVYNREDLVRRAIDSTLRQTYPNIEVIVVDNASTDGTWQTINAYAEKDQRVQCYRNDRNIGPIGNWRECLRRSRGEYIKILFSDDWLKADAIEEFVTPLSADASIGFAYSPAIFHDGVTEGSVAYQSQVAETGSVPSIDFLSGTVIGENLPVSPSCALFRREDVETALAHEWDDELGLSCREKGFGNDLFTFLFAGANHPKYYYISQPKVYFGVGTSNLTAVGFDNHMGKVRLCYRSAFAYFLRNSRLEKDLEVFLRTLLFISVMFSKNHMDMKRVLQYKRLVKERQNVWKINVFDRRILPLIFQRFEILNSRKL